jgi:hypothetical protein
MAARWSRTNKRAFVAMTIHLRQTKVQNNFPITIIQLVELTNTKHGKLLSAWASGVSSVPSRSLYYSVHRIMQAYAAKNDGEKRKRKTCCMQLSNKKAYKHCVSSFTVITTSENCKNTHNNKHYHHHNIKLRWNLNTSIYVMPMYTV